MQAVIVHDYGQAEEQLVHVERTKRLDPALGAAQKQQTILGPRGACKPRQEAEPQSCEPVPHRSSMSG